ncbi:MAG: Gfo/Idh/MocA family oxidoreductase [Paracoccaceae bacterium]
MPTQARPPFRWAILGAGGVSRKFVLGLRALGDAATPIVVASRMPENAKRFAASLGVPESASYEDAAAHPQVDAVYIATPPSEHEAHAALAIAAGKPVLIEKPFALDAAAAARIAVQAEAAGVFCMEAMWTRFLPMLDTLRARIANGEIGEIRSFEGGFFGSDAPDAANSLFDPARGGGALMHRGIYPLSLARHLLGPVSTLQAMARIGETGVDEDVALTLRHASGAISTLRASLRASGPNGAIIRGAKGVIEIAPPIYRPFKARLTVVSPRKGGTGAGGGGRFEALKEGGFLQGLNQRADGLKALLRSRAGGLSGKFEGNGYHYEAAAVAAAVTAGQGEHALMPLAESVEIMDLVDQAKSQWTEAAVSRRAQGAKH